MMAYPTREEGDGDKADAHERTRASAEGRSFSGEASTYL
jgi:hypothetical protein